MATAYRAARALDGKFERVIENGAVLTEDDRIVSVGPAAEVSPGTEVEDLGDVTLLPGLTGTHVYLGWAPPPSVTGWSRASRTP